MPRKFEVKIKLRDKEKYYYTVTSDEYSAVDDVLRRHPKAELLDVNEVFMPLTVIRMMSKFKNRDTALI